MDAISKDSEKFLNCLESCNINQHVHKPTHLHGHTLDLILTPNDSSAVSNVRVSDFISDHALVLGQLDFTNPSLPTSKTVTFQMCSINVFKIVWLELSPTPPSTHTSLLLGRFYIGCLLNNAPYLRLPYWCTSS